MPKKASGKLAAALAGQYLNVKAEEIREMSSVGLAKIMRILAASVLSQTENKEKKKP